MSEDNLRNRVIITAGVILIVLGLLINEWTLARWSCPGQVFLKDDRLRIMVFQALCILMGTGFLILRKKAFTINILLFLVSILTCFLLGEAYFRWFDPQIGGRSEQEVFFEYHETLGWQFIPSKKGILVSKHEYENTIAISSAGLRDREYPLGKPSGTKRVAVLGDSFTAGLGVKAGEVFTEVMERALGGKTEVLNFGVNGFGPTQEYLLLKTRAWQYRPDLVLMVFYIGNDFDDTTNLTAWIDGYQRPQAVLDEEGKIVFTNIPVPKTSVPKRRKMGACPLPRSHLVDFLDRMLHQQRDKYALDILPPEVRLCNKDLDTSMKTSLPLLRGILTETDAFCQRHNSRFALVLAPTVAQIYDDIYWRKIKKVYKLKDEDFDLFLPNNILAGMGKELGIPVLDLTPALRAEAGKGAELYYYKNRHWNAAGHRTAALAIAGWVKENKLLTE